MEIYRSKVMGFCYGVRRALKIAEKAADSGIKAVTYGPIIHNPQVVGQLAQRGYRRWIILTDSPTKL